MKKRIYSVLFGVAMLASLALAIPAQAQTPQPAQTMDSQQRAILAEAWTLTPQRSAHAGFTGLPLRICEGMYCGVLAKMSGGTQVDILVNDRGGWALVHVPTLNMYGWVNTNNIF